MIMLNVLAFWGAVMMTAMVYFFVKDDVLEGRKITSLKGMDLTVVLFEITMVGCLWCLAIGMVWWV